MRVSIPVMIMNLGECHNRSCLSHMGKTLNFIAPLPWFKSCGMYVQRAKADKTRDNSSCRVYECLRGSRKEIELKPTPIIKSVRGASEKRSERRLIIVLIDLTPITDTSCVLSPRVKHGTNNHEARRDGTFTNSEDETTSKETGKVLASRMTA